MKCKIFVPYISVDDTSFDNADSYWENGSYIEALQKEFNMNNDIINSFMTDSFNANNVNGNTLNIGSQLFSNNNKKEEKTTYSSCECTLLNENEQEETIDSLITYATLDDVQVMMLKLNFNSMDEEFEEDFKMWVNAHENVNKQPNVSDDWKFMNEPKRTYKISFQNLKNNTVYLDLLNCKLLDKINDDTYAILVEKVTFGESL